jgi:hypothetical protein
MSGSWRSRSRSIASLCRRRSPTRAITISTSYAGRGLERAIRRRRGKPPHTLNLRSTSRSSNSPASDDSLPPLKFLAADGGQVKGKQRVLTHGGCGGRLDARGNLSAQDLLRRLRLSRD